MTNEQKIMAKAQQEKVELTPEQIMAMCRVIEAARRHGSFVVLENGKDLMFWLKQFDELRVE
jgi:hypothetical protein